MSARAAAAPYPDGFAHLEDELRVLDLLIEHAALSVRALEQSLPADAAALHVSWAEVAALLQDGGPGAVDAPARAALRTHLVALRQEVDARVAASEAAHAHLPLPRLASLFRLSPFEVQALVVCLAPELRRKYDRLYAYLQDDVARQRPSVELVLALACASEADRWVGRRLFTPDAPLLRFGLLRVTEDPHSPSGGSDLGRVLRVDPRIAGHLLADPAPDGQIAGIARLVHPEADAPAPLVDEAVWEEARRVVGRRIRPAPGEAGRLALHLRAVEGSDHLALAQALCADLRCPLLVVDCAGALAADEGGGVLRAAFREAALQQAAVLLEGVDALTADDERARAAARRLGGVVAEYGWLTFLVGEKPWTQRAAFPPTPFHSMTLAVPGVPVRESAWRRSLEAAGVTADEACVARLARRYRLTPAQVDDAVRRADHARGPAGPGPLSFEALSAGCRSQAGHALAGLASQVDCRAEWDDLVLPPEKVALLRQFCLHLQHAYRVFEEWGFGRKLARGKGLSALFAGPPGTGKTMAAEVLARELGLDLFKVDLSAVVSKYIGETEKNLSQIFRAAETSHAILFFDEADALFGKRTEVSDAHDRYANIETSYLLQRMEEYDGAVVLASNLRGNLDEAFTRRLRFILDFPFPDASGRAAIWRRHLPAEAPVAAGIDCEALARRLAVAGGTIKNIVLSSAFLAAEDGGVITMEHLLDGARFEYEKIGKLWNGEAR